MENSEVLTGRIEASGVKPELARRVAVQLSARDALAAHARWDLGINPHEIVNPWHAAFASLISFILGAIIPLGAIVLSPAAIAVPLTVIAVTISLAITGSVSAHLGGAPEAARNDPEHLWRVARNGRHLHYRDGSGLIRCLAGQRVPRREQADPRLMPPP